MTVGPGVRGITWRALFAVVTVTMALVVTGCTRKPDKTINEEANRTTIEIEKGDILAVQLEGRAGTGYLWKVAGDPSGLELLGTPEHAVQQADPMITGGPETMTFLFKAVRKGDTALTLHYLRPWEKDDKPEKEFSVTVTVK